MIEAGIVFNKTLLIKLPLIFSSVFSLYKKKAFTPLINKSKTIKRPKISDNSFKISPLNKEVTISNKDSTKAKTILVRKKETTLCNPFAYELHSFKPNNNVSKDLLFNTISASFLTSSSLLLVAIDTSADSIADKSLLLCPIIQTDELS